MAGQHRTNHQPRVSGTWRVTKSLGDWTVKQSSVMFMVSYGCAGLIGVIPLISLGATNGYGSNLSKSIAPQNGAGKIAALSRHQVPAAPTFTEDRNVFFRWSNDIESTGNEFWRQRCGNFQEQKANMERLAQLPPPELEKLPNSTKVRCANAQFAALPDFNHGVPNTTNTLTCNVRNISQCSYCQVQLLEYLQTCPKPADGRVKAEIVKWSETIDNLEACKACKACDIDLQHLQKNTPSKLQSANTGLKFMFSLPPD